MKREPTYISTAADAQHNLGIDDPRFTKAMDV